MRAFITISFFFAVLSASAQSADDSFHSASRFFIAEQDPEAKQILDEALKKYPGDKKLRSLRDQIKEKEKEKEKDENQENKDQEQKDKEKKDQEQKDQQQKDKQSKEQQEKEQQEKEKQEKDQQQKDPNENREKKDMPPSVSEKLKEMNMSEEKAKMILEAMKNQEIQYLQQNKRKATKARDKTKPDW